MRAGRRAEGVPWPFSWSSCSISMASAIVATEPNPTSPPEVLMDNVMFSLALPGWTVQAVRAVWA